MRLEDQVVSLELAKKLKELGVKQESLFWWSEHTIPATLWSESEADEQAIWDKRQYSAFTVAELGEILKGWDSYCGVEYFNNARQGYSWYWKKPNEDFLEKSDTEANARAKMLIYLLENDLIYPSK